MIELETGLLEQGLDALHRAGAPYRGRLGIEMPAPPAFTATEIEGQTWCRDFLAQRRDWLRRRYAEHKARAERRVEAQAAVSQGISRLLDGDLGLDDLTRATAATPQAMQELRAERHAERQRERSEKIERSAA